MNTKKVKVTMEADFLIEVPEDYSDLKALEADLPGVMCVETFEGWAGNPPVDIRNHEHVDIRVSSIAFEK